MPNLTFILPHWLYWGGLGLFPIAAMVIVRRQQRSGLGAGISVATAYLFWLTGGFVGIHRLYLRNWWGVIYIPLFMAILFMNVEGRAAREVFSRTHRDLQVAEFELDRAKKEQQEGKLGAVEQAATVQASMEKARAENVEADQRFGAWSTRAGWIAAVIALMLLGDAILLPSLTKRCIAREGGLRPLSNMIDPEAVLEKVSHKAPGTAIHTHITNEVDQVNGFFGEYIGYWSIIAVFVYYYEVLARYVFNSPTNWAHESMFLMFGMQYLLAGGYAFREDAHVRVDVLYVLLSDRNKVRLDLLTAVFFFLFNGVLLVTGYVFVQSAIEVGEVSMTEWGIQYWAVKIALPLGAVLILLQGCVRVFKNITYLRTKEI